MPYYFKRKPKKDKPLPLFEKAGVTVKKKPDLKAKLDKEFSLFIRLRDSKPYGYKAFKCICCGKILPFEKADAGHFFSRRHNSVRFDESNVHAECRYDNRFNAEHLEYYRENLKKKIGQKNFEVLKWKSVQTKHWADFELKELIKYYKALNKKMLAER